MQNPIGVSDIINSNKGLILALIAILAAQSSFTPPHPIMVPLFQEVFGQDKRFAVAISINLENSAMTLWAINEQCDSQRKQPGKDRIGLTNMPIRRNSSSSLNRKS